MYSVMFKSVDLVRPFDFPILSFFSSRICFPSVPLYWLQTGYGLKPPPVIATDRTHEQQMDALKRHFLRTIPQHGPHVCATVTCKSSCD